MELEKDLDIDKNIIRALERISDSFSVMMWEHNKQHGLSFIQLKIINFIMFNSLKKDRNISFISKEFNISKPSLSDSIKNLEKKGLIFKSKSSSDSRVELINLTDKGKEIAEDIFGFTGSLENIISRINVDKKEALFESLMFILHSLFNKKVVSIQVMCSNCEFYVDKGNNNFECFFANDMNEYNKKFNLLEENNGNI